MEGNKKYKIAYRWPTMHTRNNNVNLKHAELIYLRFELKGLVSFSGCSIVYTSETLKCSSIVGKRVGLFSWCRGLICTPPFQSTTCLQELGNMVMGDGGNSVGKLE